MTTTRTTAQVDTTASPSPRVSGPGGQLRQARLDLKLTLEDVGRVLHLSPRQIEAVENNDYERLPGPTYVRGYLRGYALLLGLASEPILEAYNRSVAVAKPVDLGKLNPEPEIHSGHQMVKLGTIAVAIVVIGLSALWWQEQPSQQTYAPAVVEKKEAPDAERVMPPAGNEYSPANPTANEPTPVENRSETPPVPAPTPVTPEPAAPAIPPTTTAPVTPTAPSRSVAVTTPSSVEGERVKIVFRAAEDSWAEVRDAQDNRLLYGTISAGRAATVEGVAPLSVFLGNVNGVTVEYNGQPYNAARHRRGDIARFTLGEPPKPQ